MIDIHGMTDMFRKVLDAYSRPGNQYDVSGTKHHTSFYDTTYLLAATLLDNEVSFHMFTNDFAQDKGEFEMILNSHVTEINAADYILIQHDFPVDTLKTYLSESKNGSFKDPDQSATWVIELPNFDEGKDYALTGPGIETQKQVKLLLHKDIIEVRNTLCSEYPLGIDMIFVTKESVMAIPRTTVIKEVE